MYRWCSAPTATPCQARRGVTLADRNEPAATTLALLAHSIGLAIGARHGRLCLGLLAEFDPALIPRRPVRITDALDVCMRPDAV